MKLLVSIFFIIILLGAVAGFAFYYFNENPSNNQDKKNIEFEIKEGWTASTIASSLEKQKIIKKALFMKLYLKIYPYNSFQAGFYTLDSSLTTLEIIDVLKKGGRSKEISFTIIEGLNIEQVADSLLQQQVIDDAKLFIDLAYNAEYAHSRGIAGPSVEGFLYPNTYFILERMVGNEQEVLGFLIEKFFEIPYKSIEGMRDLSKEELYKIVIIASLIERESLLNEEDALISSVIYNRIQNGWDLQIDATVAYALMKTGAPYPKRVLYEMLKIKSPYNTYLPENNGKLLPTPIASPSFSSLKAALYPENTEYFYYVALADFSGRHAFSKANEYSNHLAKAKEYQQALNKGQR